MLDIVTSIKPIQALIAGYLNTHDMIIRSWQLTSHQKQHKICFSQDEKLLLTLDPHTISIWSTHNCALLDTFTSNKIFNDYLKLFGNQVIFLKDNRIVFDCYHEICKAPDSDDDDAIAGDYIKPIDLEMALYIFRRDNCDKKIMYTETIPIRQSEWRLDRFTVYYQSNISSLALAPDNNHIAFASGHKLFIYNLDTDKITTRFVCPHDIHTCVYSKASKLLAIGSQDGQITIIALNNYKKVQSLKVKAPLISLIFSASDNFLIAGYNNEISIFDLRQDYLISHSLVNNSTVTALSLFEDTLVIGWTNCPSSMWDFTKNRSAYFEKIDFAQKLAYSPQGKYLAQISGSNEITLFGNYARLLAYQPTETCVVS